MGNARLSTIFFICFQKAVHFANPSGFQGNQRFSKDPDVFRVMSYHDHWHVEARLQLEEFLTELFSEQSVQG